MYFLCHYHFGCKQTYLLVLRTHNLIIITFIFLQTHIRILYQHAHARERRLRSQPLQCCKFNVCSFFFHQSKCKRVRAGARGWNMQGGAFLYVGSSSRADAVFSNCLFTRLDPRQRPVVPHQDNPPFFLQPKRSLRAPLFSPLLRVSWALHRLLCLARRHEPPPPPLTLSSRGRQRLSGFISALISSLLRLRFSSFSPRCRAH